MQRHVIGIIGLLGLAYYLMWAAGFAGTPSEFFPAMCMRLGFSCCTIWLAVPDIKSLLEKYPPWMIGGLLILIATLILNPKIFLAVAFMMAIALGISFLFRLVKFDKGKAPKKDQD